MPRFEINFKVDGKTQTITAVGNKKIRAGSKNYWYATFTFLDSAFEGLDYLSASFSKKPYSPDRTDAIIVPIINNECQVPWEMLTKKRKFYVGVFAGDMLVTNEEIIEVTAAALTAGVYTEPTASWFDIFLDQLALKQDKLIAGENIEINEDNEISAQLTNALLYVAQELSEEQKLQARINIGAGTNEIFIVDFAKNELDESYYTITSYEDFIEAFRSGKTIWGRVQNSSGTYILSNFRETQFRYEFWDVFPLSLDIHAADLIKITAEVTTGRQGTILAPTFSTKRIPSVGDIPTYTVRYSAQELTDAQKEQARANIGAGTDQTYFIEFQEYPLQRRFISISSYDEYLALKARRATLSAKIQLASDEEVILNNFTDEGEIVYFWDLIPSNDISSPAKIQCMTCVDDGEKLISFYISEIELAGSASVQDRLDDKAQKVTRVINDTDGQVSVILDSNVVYWFTGDISSLNITLNTESDEPEVLYHFYYKAGSSAPMITLPDSIGYASGARDALTSTDTIVEVTIGQIPEIEVSGITYNYLAYAGRLETGAWR